MCVVLLAVHVFGGCQQSPEPPQSGTDTLAWIDGGAAAWAEHLSREPTEDRNGFAAMCALAEWVRSTPPPADDREAEMRWAERYALLVGEIASSRHWSGEPRWSSAPSTFSSDRVADGLSDSVCFVSTREIIAIFRECERMMDVLRQESPESSASLVRDVFRFAEMIGRRGADKDRLIAQIQLTAGAMAAEGLVKSVAANPDDIARYTAIRDDIVAYVEKESLRLRGK